MLTTLAGEIARRVTALDRSRNGFVYFGLLSIVLLLLLASIGLTAWSNEEHYFQLAFRRVSPASFTPYHTPFDQSDLRFLFEYIAGYAVSWLGFDRATIVSRIVMALCYAASLTCFFKSFNLSVLDGAAVVIVFHLAGEGLMGGEWLFKAAESKTFAYALVFLAFGLANYGRWYAAVFACAAAGYFHFLVGGFWGLVILGVSFWDRRIGGSADQRISVIKGFVAFCLLLSPLFYIIAHEQMAGATPAPGGLSADQTYAAFRVPHHVAPFSLNPPFGGWWLPLAVTVGLAVMVAVLIRRGFRSIPMLAGLVGLVELILAVPITWLDRNTFLLSKLYLFRPSSVTLFLVMCGLAHILKDKLTVAGRQATNLLLCVLIVGFVSAGLVAHATGLRRVYPPPGFDHLVAAIGTHTRPEEIVLIDPSSENRYLRLHRTINRPTLVAWKFLPTNPEDILRWYSLLELRERIYETGCASPMQGVPVRWLVATDLDTNPKPAECGPVLWREGPIGLIQVDPK